jgi:hypothetical protein
VRHVRMLGFGLIMALVAVAVTAASALAFKNPDQSLKIFQNCPVNGQGEVAPGEFREDIACTVGATEPNEGGQFTVGPITVPITKQIVLQYGLTQNEETDALVYIPPINGAEAITPTPEKVPGEPIAHISEAEQEELGWPETLKYSYKQAQKHHTAKTVYETIEQAGNNIETSIQRILEEEGNGVEVGVKIKGENKWLSELGDACYIGSSSEPIVQELTSGESTSPLTGETIHGSKGELLDTKKNALAETHSNLVDNRYAVPGASCTGPYASVIEATIDKEFDIPAPAGASITEIKGTLYLASAEEVREAGF